MNQTKDAFNQVKAILGKLDRSITEARTKRLGEVLTDQGDEDSRPVDKVIDRPDKADEVESRPEPSTQQVQGGYARLRGQFGRAKPIKRPDRPLTNP